MFKKGHGFSQETLEKMRIRHAGHFKKGQPPIPHRKGCLCFRCLRKPNKTSFKKGLTPWNRAGKFIKCFYCGKEKWYKPSQIKLRKRFFCNFRCLGNFRKGKTPWNKGLKLPQHTLEQRKAKSLRQKGKNSHFWRGGKTNKNFLIRHGLKYKLWREKVFKRDDYTCQMCKKRGGKLQADHVKPFSLYPKLRFVLKNGRTLCIDCHKKTPTYLLKLV